MNSNTIRLDTGFRAGTRETRGWLGRAKNAWQALRLARRRRRAIVELSRMSDWRLADMGIPRGRISDVVDGLIERDRTDFRR